MNENPQVELTRLARELLERARAVDESEWDWTATKAEIAAPSPLPSPLGRGSKGEGAVVAGNKAAALAALSAEVEACRKCPLGSARLHPAFGVGSAEAKVMFVGEGPGFEEDHRGEPFVGKAGQLLDKILAAIGLSRSTVYIANIVKCHPMVDPSDAEKRGNDRPPTASEAAACRSYLDRQIEIIRPKVIVTLGNVPARFFLETAEGITTLRGKWKTYDPGTGAPAIKLLPTYHPAALLRNPDLKRDVWEDMKSLKKELESAV